jgi:hypothetical protein
MCINHVRKTLKMAIILGGTFCPKNAMFSSLMLPQIINAFKNFVAYFTLFGLFFCMLNSDMAGQVGLSHFFGTIWTNSHKA